MVEHFWNAQNVADTACFQSPRLLLDYVYLLKQVEENDSHIRNLVSLSCKRESTFGLILYWLDNILYDSSSPHYDEALYMKFMDAVLASEADSVMKLIPQQRKEIMSKNRVGCAANNFSFIDKTGEERNLYSIDATMLLLEFNNPDCSLCHQAEEYISESAMLQAMLNSGRLVVLSVTPDADYEYWMGHNYPANWLVGYDKEKVIYSQQLYDIQRLPCFYLLDKDKRVLLKEAGIDRVLDFLGKYIP